VKDENDVIGVLLRRIFEEGFDGILIADNGSTDGTRETIELFAQRKGVHVVIVDDPEVGYYQADKMTTLANRAHVEFDATWVVPVDADEVWFNNGDRLAHYLRESEYTFVDVPMFDHIPTAIDRYEGETPFHTMVYRRAAPNPFTKVAVRWEVGFRLTQGNHGVDFASPEHRASFSMATSTTLEIRHFPYRSFEQFLRKVRNGAAAYAATDLPVSAGAHWRQYGELFDRYGVDALRRVWSENKSVFSPTDNDLVNDPAPIRRWTVG
jgi:glycosyltransferase involved in cell wall biosynthesis